MSATKALLNHFIMLIRSHPAGVFRLDLQQNALLAGLGEWVFIFVEILLRHLVDVLAGAALGHLHYTPADLDVVIGIVGIDQSDSNPGVALHVAMLLPAFRSIDDQAAIL